MGQLIRDHDAAYLAGHLDGDGSITDNGSGYVRVQWISAHKTTINEIRRMLRREGVTAYVKNVGGSKNVLWCVCIYRQDDCKFTLERIAPYLVVKSDQAWTVLGAFGSRLKHYHTPLGWDYLAGLLDTDGHVTQQQRWKNGGLTYRVAWTQKYKRGFSEIQAFLSEAGIASKPILLHSGVWQLRVLRQGEILILLEEMLPYLITKAAKAKKTISDVQERWEICVDS